MIKTFTQDDVLLYIYHELPAQEALELEEQLTHDHQLMHFYQECKGIVRSMYRAQLSPPESAVERIMQYARQR
jgi:hypothetical protein